MWEHYLWVFSPPSGKPLGMIQSRRIHHEPITPTAFQTSVTIATRFNDKMDKTNSLNCKTIQHFLRAMLGCLEGISSLFGGQFKIARGYFQVAWRPMPCCLEGITRLLGEHFQDVWRAMPGCLEAKCQVVWRAMPGCSRVFSDYSEGNFRLFGG